MSGGSSITVTPTCSADDSGARCTPFNVSLLMRHASEPVPAVSDDDQSSSPDHSSSSDECDKDN